MLGAEFMQAAEQGFSVSDHRGAIARAFSSQAESPGGAENATKQKFSASPMNESERKLH
jgi:hypothetical protein